MVDSMHLLTGTRGGSLTPPTFRERHHRGLAGRLFVYFRFEFLIRRPQLQILFLHNGRELVEIF
jgi:hypothetical protein